MQLAVFVQLGTQNLTLQVGKLSDTASDDCGACPEKVTYVHAAPLPLERPLVVLPHNGSDRALERTPYARCYYITGRLAHRTHLTTNCISVTKCD